MTKSVGRFKLLVVSHAADGTGAPISTLALCREWAARGDVELEVLLRRNGQLRPAFEDIAPTWVARMNPQNFGLGDAFKTAFSGNPKLALKGLRNSDRPYIQNTEDRLKLAKLAAHYQAFTPDAIYVSTTHCGDAIVPLGLTAPILTHVREMEGVIAALDPERRDFALKQSAAFAAVSRPVKDTLTQTYGIEADKITIEPPAINLAAMPSDATQHPSDADTRPLMLGIGSLIPRKGPNLFLEIAAKSKKRGLPFRFIWLGDGEMRRELMSATTHLDLDDHLEWIGQVDDPYPMLRDAAALALTSIEDPHPRTMIEAAALGTPVVAFAGTGGADQFLPEYSAGTLVPIPDTTAFLAALEAQIGHRTNPAPVRVQFDVKMSAERLLEQLKALAA
jgi:glycosyltransferase involved in cell wall biosynthesis